MLTQQHTQHIMLRSTPRTQLELASQQDINIQVPP